jgi:hypothetical protein
MLRAHPTRCPLGGASSLRVPAGGLFPRGLNRAVTAGPPVGTRFFIRQTHQHIGDCTDATNRDGPLGVIERLNRRRRLRVCAKQGHAGAPVMPWIGRERRMDRNLWWKRCKQPLANAVEAHRCSLHVSTVLCLPLPTSTISPRASIRRLQRLWSRCRPQLGLHCLARKL